MSSDRGNRQAVDWSTRQCWHPQLKTSSYWAYHRHSVSKCDNTGAFKTKSERLFYCAVGSPFGYSVFLLYNLHCTLYNKNENIAVFISYCFHKEHRESFFNFLKLFFVCVCGWYSVTRALGMLAHFTDTDIVRVAWKSCKIGNNY